MPKPDERPLSERLPELLEPPSGLPCAADEAARAELTVREAARIVARQEAAEAQPEVAELERRAKRLVTHSDYCGIDYEFLCEYAADLRTHAASLVALSADRQALAEARATIERVEGIAAEWSAGDVPTSLCCLHGRLLDAAISGKMGEPPCPPS